MKKLYLEWITATAIGELVGFSVPIVIGIIVFRFIGLFSSPVSEIIMLLAMIIAGIGEGIILAFAQWIILKKYIKDINKNEWIFFTAIAAAAGWAIGMLPSQLGRTSIHPLILLIGIIVLAPIFLLSIGFAQWLVLRHHIKNAWWWIVANAIAWPIGVFVSILVLVLVPDESPAVVWIISAIMAGIMMGVTVGAITGIALVKLITKSTKIDAHR